MSATFDHFNATVSIAFQELKEELELQGKTVTFNISEDMACITIMDMDMLELEYKIEAEKDGGDDGDEGGKKILMSTIQYINTDGKMVIKEARFLHEGIPIEPVRAIKEILINDILNKYRSSNPFAKIVMSPYSDFYE